MARAHKYRAVVAIGNDAQSAVALKRLALFFDEIRYLRSYVPAVLVSNEGIPNGFERNSEGFYVARDFDYFRDAVSRLFPSRSALAPALIETLDTFSEHGVAVEITPPSPGDTTLGLPLKLIADQLVVLDMQDTRFNEISGTPSEQYHLDRLISRQSLAVIPDDGSAPIAFHPVNEPIAMHDSRLLTEVLCAAQSTGAHPVFITDRHRREMAYRHSQLREAPRQALGLADIIGIDGGTPGTFGEVVFEMANATMLSDAVAARSAEEIVTYRAAMDSSRRKLVSRDLHELSQLVAGNPWSDEVKSEVRRYVTGKLEGDLAEYETRAADVWKKLYGSLSVEVTRAAQFATMAGAAGYLAGAIAPGASPSALMLAGLLAGAARVAPGIVSALVEAMRGRSELRCSSIAYLAGLVHSR